MIGETNAINIIGEDWTKEISTFAFISRNNHQPVVQVNLPDYCSTLSNSFSNLTSGDPYKQIIINKTISTIPLRNLSQAFYQSNIERITFNIDTKDTVDWRNTFKGCSCQVIDGLPLNMSGATSSSNASGVFQDCTELEEVRFVPETIKHSLFLKQSSKLSNETIESIINGLKTGIAYTITFHPDIVLSTEQRNRITSKNWKIVQ